MRNKRRAKVYRFVDRRRSIWLLLQSKVWHKTRALLLNSFIIHYSFVLLGLMDKRWTSDDGFVEWRIGWVDKNCRIDRCLVFNQNTSNFSLAGSASHTKWSGTVNIPGIDLINKKLVWNLVWKLFKCYTQAPSLIRNLTAGMWPLELASWSGVSNSKVMQLTVNPLVMSTFIMSTLPFLAA